MSTGNPLDTPDPLAALLGLGPAGSRFPPNSRYAAVPVAAWQGPGGTTVVYLRRRFVPPPERLIAVGEHVVGQGERLDTIAASTLGDPELFWRLCDANRAMRPDDLAAEAGGRLRVALPGSGQAAGRG